MQYQDKIKDYLKLEKEIIDKLDVERINEFVNVLVDTYNNGGTIYTFGNGGSAATASHFVCDFNKGVSMEFEKKFNFVCLNDNTPIVMAVANDISYDEIFRFQLKNKLKPNDILIGISGSGNSKNVVLALEYGKQCRNKTIGLTGYSGGKLKDIVDIHVNVPIDNMQITEDVHMILDHMIMTILYNSFKGK